MCTMPCCRGSRYLLMLARCSGGPCPVWRSAALQALHRGKLFMSKQVSPGLKPLTNAAADLSDHDPQSQHRLQPRTWGSGWWACSCRPGQSARCCPSGRGTRTTRLSTRRSPPRRCNTPTHCTAQRPQTLVVSHGRLGLSPSEIALQPFGPSQHTHIALRMAHSITTNVWPGSQPMEVLRKSGCGPSGEPQMGLAPSHLMLSNSGM